jgi:phage tail-like protein
METKPKPAVTIAPNSPVELAHVADSYTCYPGETVTLHTRLRLRRPAANLWLRLALPPNMELKDYRAPAQQVGLVPAIEVTPTQHYLVWPLDGDLPARTVYEYCAQIIMPHGYNHEPFISHASVTDPDGQLLAAESVQVVVSAKSNYLRYLPALYQEDDFMGRFLMLFESFWQPVHTQIGSLYNYFDPRITPDDILPWLSSWLGLELSESWPAGRLRELIRMAMALHRTRGTAWGVSMYLALYTGQQPEIIEGRSQNFNLGIEALLGPGLALGQENVPHSFTINLSLPAIRADSPEKQKQLENLRRRTLEAIIERQKPAHTIYILNLHTLSDEEDIDYGA